MFATASKYYVMIQNDNENSNALVQSAQLLELNTMQPSKKFQHYILITSQLWLTSHPRSTVVLEISI